MTNIVSHPPPFSDNFHVKHCGVFREFLVIKYIFQCLVFPRKLSTFTSSSFIYFFNVSFYYFLKANNWKQCLTISTTNFKNLKGIYYKSIFNSTETHFFTFNFKIKYAFTLTVELFYVYFFFIIINFHLIILQKNNECKIIANIILFNYLLCYRYVKCNIFFYFVS